MMMGYWNRYYQRCKGSIQNAMQKRFPMPGNIGDHSNWCGKAARWHGRSMKAYGLYWRVRATIAGAK